MESEIPPGIQLSVDPLLQDENSMDSTDRSADPVDREFVESAVSGLDKSINVTILENRALMVEKLADLKKTITSRSGNGITLDYMVMALRKRKAKNKKLQLALDQEEQKRALSTRNYNKNVKELRLENQALTSEISDLRKTAQFSSILRSIDQKLQFQTSMQVYESSSDGEGDADLPQDQTAVQGDQGENGQFGLADGADGGLPYIDTAEQVVADAFGNRDDEDGLCEEDRFWKGESAYEAFDEFKERLLIHHLRANLGNSKRLDVSRPPISDDAFRRYLDIALHYAYTKNGNKISKSTAAHRELLQRLNGSIICADDFNELHGCLLGTVSHLREKLDLPNEPDLCDVFDPVDDVFHLEEEMELFGFENGALLMDKLQKRVYRHWRERVLEVPSITQAVIDGEYTELHFQMYYAFIHRFGQTKHYVKSKEVDHVNYLKIVTGRFFDAATVVAMETPLVKEIIRLRDLVLVRPYMQQKLQIREILMLNRAKHPRVGGSEVKRVCGKRKSVD